MNLGMPISVVYHHQKHTNIVRCIGSFGKKGKRFRKAVDLTKEHRYVKAKDVYQNNMDGFSNKVQGKALYNMAILHDADG